MGLGLRPQLTGQALPSFIFAREGRWGEGVQLPEAGRGLGTRGHATCCGQALLQGTFRFATKLYLLTLSALLEAICLRSSMISISTCDASFFNDSLGSHEASIVKNASLVA